MIPLPLPCVAHPTSIRTIYNIRLFPRWAKSLISHHDMCMLITGRLYQLKNLNVCIHENKIRGGMYLKQMLGLVTWSKTRSVWGLMVTTIDFTFTFCSFTLFGPHLSPKQGILFVVCYYFNIVEILLSQFLKNSLG